MTKIQKLNRIYRAFCVKNKSTILGISEKIEEKVKIYWMLIISCQAQFCCHQKFLTKSKICHYPYCINFTVVLDAVTSDTSRQELQWNWRYMGSWSFLILSEISDGNKFGLGMKLLASNSILLFLQFLRWWKKRYFFVTQKNYKCGATFGFLSYS